MKDAFAAALLRTPTDPFFAACTLFENRIHAMEVAKTWPYDLYVLQRQADLIDQLGDEAFLPNKAELARRVYEVAGAATDTKDRLLAYKLYGEIRGFIEKAGGANVNVNVNNNRVMVVKDFGTFEEWEQKSIRQQQKLVEHSRD